jgi:hypothetical protein
MEFPVIPMTSRRSGMGAAVAETASGVLDLALRARSRAWEALRRFLVDRLCAGEFNGKFLLHPVSVSDPRIGRSHSFPGALRFVIGPGAGGFPAGIGDVVHRALFPDAPQMALKVVFGCARRDLLGRSAYADPTSIWYNVFFGYYEIVVSKRAWRRPFGYDTDSRGGRVRFEDLVRLAKGDWNHLSNELYGVPPDAIESLDAVNMAEVGIRQLPRERIASGVWDTVELSNLRVAGPARSSHDGRDFADRDPLLGFLWRTAFGRSARSSAITASFAPTSMRARFHLSHTTAYDALHREDVYKTYLFGGTVNEAYPDPRENGRFLDLQMEAVRKIIEREGNLGFADDAAAPAHVATG